MTRLNPSHPGLIVEDVLSSQKISPSTLAKAMKVSPSTISRIIRGKMGISADLALRLEKTLNINARLLVDMQAAFDLREAQKAKENDNIFVTLPNLLEARDFVRNL